MTRRELRAMERRQDRAAFTLIVAGFVTSIVTALTLVDWGWDLPL